MHNRYKIVPDFEWYKNKSEKRGTSVRCPFATVERCPRYYESLSLLGSAGSTSIDEEIDKRLKEKWSQSDVWPVTYEQATSISGPDDRVTSFSNYCPEVTFDRFGLFATYLHKYTDEIDQDNAHIYLEKNNIPITHWAWEWESVIPLHYCDCIYYSLLNQPASHITKEKGPEQLDIIGRVTNRLRNHWITAIIFILIIAVGYLGDFTQRIKEFRKYIKSIESEHFSQVQFFSIVIINKTNRDISLSSSGSFNLIAPKESFSDSIVATGRFIIGDDQDDLPASKEVIVPAGESIDVDCKIINSAEYNSYILKGDISLVLIVSDSFSKKYKRSGLSFTKDDLTAEPIAIYLE
jgi:hypothetical protein